jgi:VWFA-related protein
MRTITRGSVSGARPGRTAARQPVGVTAVAAVAVALFVAALTTHRAIAQTPAFRAGTRLVVQTVSVHDAEGRPIEGLTARDFIVTEDGDPQTVSLLEFQRLNPVPESSPTPGPDSSSGGTAVANAATGAPPGPAPVGRPASSSPTTSAIAGAAPGTLRYHDRRLLVLYFDLTALPSADLLRAYYAALRYVGERMTDSDLVALMSFEGGAVRVKVDFTSDRRVLRDALDRLVFGNDLDGDGIPDIDVETGSAFGQDDAEFNILNTDRQLSALQTAAEMLRVLPDRKTLVYFSSGLRLNGVDNQAQLRATTNAALRAGVAIFPVDARGLLAEAPLGDATRPSPGGAGVFTGRLAESIVSGFQRSQDSLYSLAKDTGGTPFLDNNDLTLGIVRAAQAVTSYYILGYYSTHTALDGRFHRVRIALAPGRSAELAYRQGYFADKSFGKFTAADKERQLEDALMLENPVTDLTLAVEVNYFQLNRAEYFVPVAVKIPGRELTLARRRGARRTVIDVIGEVKDDYGATIQNLRDKIELALADDAAARVGEQPIHYDTGFTLLPGAYVLKILARDGETGRIGTFQTSFTIPNLVREERRVPTSSVVLASQRVTLGDALYSVKRNGAAQTANPLVSDGVKLVPSVTRVFSRRGDLYVFLQAYQRAATTTQPLAAFVTFYKNDRKIFETEPIAIVDGLDPRSKAVPIRLRVPLASVPTGRFECQVTVLDPTQSKAAFWRAPIVVVR